LVLVCILIPVLALLYFVQDRMMFYASHCLESREALQGMPGFREVAFTAENGREYRGYQCCSPAMWASWR